MFRKRLLPFLGAIIRAYLQTARMVDTMNAMERTTRRIVFYLFVITFVVTGPLAVLSSLGYTFRTDTATFETTGGIFVKSQTTRTNIFLDGTFVKETGFLTGSALLTDVRPGLHVVRLEKSAHRPWIKSALVAPGTVTEFRDVFLVPYDIAAATSTPAELANAQATSTPAANISLDKQGKLARTERGIRRVIADNVHSFARAHDAVFFVGQTGFLARYDLAGGDIRTIERPGFFLNREPVRFIDGENFLAIIDSSGGLFLYDRAADTIRPVTSGVKDVSFDTEETKLLIAREQQIDVLWLAANDRQPFQKEWTMETAVTETDRIRQASWYYETDAHVVYRTRLGLFIAELDARGGSNVVPLAADAVDDLITSPLAPGTIFFRRGKGIYKIEL